MIPQLLLQISKIALQWGLHPEIAARFVVINKILSLWGLTPLVLVSGYRDAEKQRMLRENWDAGREVYPVGMPVVRPACDSNHTVTMGGLPASLAFDATGSPQTKELFARLWTIFNGAKWGGWFANPDPNHYHASMMFTQRNPIC